MNLHDWSVTDLLALYKSIDAHASGNPEPIFSLCYSESSGWNSEQNSLGDQIEFTEREACLIMLFSGQEWNGNQLFIHLYSIAGQFRQAARHKLEKEIPAPPAKWFNYLKGYRTNWTPEDKVKPEPKEKNPIIRRGSKINEAPVPFPKASTARYEEPPF